VQKDVVLKHKRAISWRTLFLTASLFNLMGFILYGGDMTAQLSAPTPVGRLLSFGEMMEKDYVMLMTFGGLSWTILMNAPEDSDLKTAFRTVWDTNLADVCHDISCKLEQLRRQDMNIAYFESSLTFINQPGVDILYHLDEAHPYQLAIALAKDSDLTALFNYNIIKLYQSGLMEKLRHKWFAGMSPGDRSGRIFVQGFSPIGWTNLIFPLFVFFSGIISCAILFTVEATTLCALRLWKKI